MSLVCGHALSQRRALLGLWVELPSLPLSFGTAASWAWERGSTRSPG
jgi:hypothetical protein